MHGQSKAFWNISADYLILTTDRNSHSFFFSVCEKNDNFLVFKFYVALRILTCLNPFALRKAKIVYNLVSLNAIG